MIPNTSGLQEYTTEELLIELMRRAKLQKAYKDAISTLFDNYLIGRVRRGDIVYKMYDAGRNL